VYFKDLESQKAKNRVKPQLFTGLNLPQTPASIPVSFLMPPSAREARETLRTRDSREAATKPKKARNQGWVAKLRSAVGRLLVHAL